MKALAHAQDPDRIQDLADIQVLLRHVSVSDYPALAAAAAEIGDDVAAVLQPLLSRGGHEDEPGNGPARI